MVTNGLALAAHFGDGSLRIEDMVDGLVGAVVNDPVHDAVAWREYLETVVRDRRGWGDFYACRGRGTRSGERSPLRHPPPRSRLRPLGRARPRRAAARHRAPRTARRRPIRSWRSPPTTACGCRWRCSAMSSTDRERAVFLPFAVVQSRVAGRAVRRRALPCRSGCMDLPLAASLAARRTHAGRRAGGGRRRSAAIRRSIRWRCWRQRRATTTPSVGGTTWSSTAATGSPPFDAIAEAMAAMRGRCDDGTPTRSARGPPGSAHAPGDPRARARRVRADRRRVRRLARSGVGPSRRDHGDDGRRACCGPPHGQGRPDVGAVDASPTRRGQRVRRRRRLAGLVRARLPAPPAMRVAAAGSSAPRQLLRGRRHRRVARRPHRRVRLAEDAGGAAQPPSARAGRADRRRLRRAGAAAAAARADP